MKKYLGFTLLPHFGVSLVFTGIAVSILNNADPESSRIVQGIIAAAAVIDEIIAVIIAKRVLNGQENFKNHENKKRLSTNKS